MAKWIERSHPQVVTGAVILGYIAAFGSLLALLGSSRSVVPSEFQLLFLAAFIGGAYGTANNKKLAHAVLATAASLAVLFETLHLITVAGLSGKGIALTLETMNAMVFSVALVVAVFHPQTLGYRKTWFE